MRYRPSLRHSGIPDRLRAAIAARVEAGSESTATAAVGTAAAAASAARTQGEAFAARLRAALS